MLRSILPGRGARTPAAEGDEAAAAVASPVNDAGGDRPGGSDRPEPEGADANVGDGPGAQTGDPPAARPLSSGPPAGPEDSGTERADRPRPSREPGQAPSVALQRGALVAFALALVLAVVVGVLWNAGRAAEADRQAVLEAAQQATVSLTSVNFETAEQDVRRVLDTSTGDFGGLFEQNLDSYIGLVKESKIVTHGEVTGAGIDRIDPTTARAVVAIKANVKNQSVPKGEDRFYRIVTELEKKDGEWLVSRVEFVP